MPDISFFALFIWKPFFSDAFQETFGLLLSQARLFRVFTRHGHSLHIFAPLTTLYCVYAPVSTMKTLFFVPSNTGPLISHFVPRRVFENTTLFQASDCLLWHSNLACNVFCDLEHSKHNRP